MGQLDTGQVGTWWLPPTLSTVYTVQSTLYSVHCTLYTVHCTLYTVQCTVYIVQCTVYSGHSTVCTIQGWLHSIHNPGDQTCYPSACSAHCSSRLKTTQCGVCTAGYTTLNCIHYTLYRLYTVHCIHYTPYIVNRTLFTVHCSPYAVQLYIEQWTQCSVTYIGRNMPSCGRSLSKDKVLVKSKPQVIFVASSGTRRL